MTLPFDVHVGTFLQKTSTAFVRVPVGPGTLQQSRNTTVHQFLFHGPNAWEIYKCAVVAVEVPASVSSSFICRDYYL